MKLNVVVVGLGEVGRYIARVLLDEGHDLVLIDQSLDVVNLAEEQFDAMVLRGHAASPRVLQEARAHEADLLIAVTDQDEINMLSALQAKQLGAKQVMARVSNQIYFDDERGLHNDVFGAIDLVLNPEVLVAMEIQKLAGHVGVVAMEYFASGRIEMVEMKIVDTGPNTHKPLHTLSLPANTLIAAIDRDGQLIIPKGNDEVRPGDEVLAVGRIDQIPMLEHSFVRGERRSGTPRVIIVGGSDIAIHIAKALANNDTEVILIEQARARCDELADHLGADVTILQGDGTDMHLLDEERVGLADVFIAASDADEVNLMAALLARDLGTSQVMALVHKPDYGRVCQRLGIDITLSPRLAVAQQVLTHVTTGRITSVRPVLDGRGEFVELITSPRSRVVGKLIKDLNFPKQANICAVVGARGAFVPRGHDTIEGGDRVVVFTTPRQRPVVEKFFAAHTGWFG